MSGWYVSILGAWVKGGVEDDTEVGAELAGADGDVVKFAREDKSVGVFAGCDGGAVGVVELKGGDYALAATYQRNLLIQLYAVRVLYGRMERVGLPSPPVDLRGLGVVNNLPPLNFMSESDMWRVAGRL